MSWTQVLSDVTSRLSAASASQSLQTLSPYHSHWNHSSISHSPTSQVYGPTASDYQFQPMSVRIQLDQPNVPFFTNLDIVTGRVILSLATDTTVAAVNVKLEGESRTRLVGLRGPHDGRNRQRVSLEMHKLLYKPQTVFPEAGVTQDPGNAQFVLPPGQYSYPFEIKIPINNDCQRNSGSLGSLLTSDIMGARHVKQTLPPTLKGFPGEAEIKYFIKATVVRPKFYQENIRSIVDLNFLPIEPPRTAPRNEETFARRQHQFQAYTTASSPKSSKGGLFKKPSISAPVQPEEPLAIRVEARLPSPTIITCQQPLPLRILVEKTNDSSASLYLSLLQIELIGYTNVRAHELARTETQSWMLVSHADMKSPLTNPSDKSTRSFQVPSGFWDTIPLPNTVPPSFNTCNISRKYEVEVRVGISHGMADGIRPELIVVPLRVPVEVYSGIAPPQQLLNRIPTQIVSNSNLAPPQPNTSLYQSTPVTPTQDQFPAQAGSYIPPSVDDPDDLPPSYEDAIAEDITPVDGPRRNFSSSEPAGGMRHGTNLEPRSYSSGLDRHGSERLFSQNAPSPPDPILTAGLQQGQNNQIISPTPASDTAQQPPPLPIRKGTVDSLKGRNGKY